MDEGLKHIELIEAYVEGRMSEADRAAFEVRIQTDADLSEEYELYQKIRTSFLDIQEERMRQQFARIDRDLDLGKAEGTGGSSGFRMWIAVAAVSVMAILIFWKVFSGKFDSGQEIAALLPVEEGLPVLMSSVDRNKSFADAMTQFKLEDFRASAVRFSQLSLKDPLNDTLLYFSGYSFLKLTEYPSAIDCFEKVVGQPGSVFFKKSQYCLSLAYWGAGKKGKAEELSDLILQDPDHPYFQETERLKKSMLRK
ncbi:MAG: hypothetical protein ACO1HD_13895 [Bacteroidota bacterium]